MSSGAKESFLTPLKAAARRRSFLTFDIESKDGDSQEAGFTRPFLVGLYDGANYEGMRNLPSTEDLPWDEAYYAEGGCIDRAMRFVLRGRYRGFHIYAHNGGRFDFLFTLPWLMNVGHGLGYRFSLIPVSSSIQVLDVWHGANRKRGVWRFLDSLKLIPTSLDKAAKSFGLKGKAAHDLNMHESDERWEEYNAQDCSELYEVVKKFHGYVEGVLLGEVGITAPSTAVKLFRRRFLRQKLPRHTDVHEFVRSGYVGGRTEPFEERAGGLRYFDVNSSYAAAMTEDMPSGDCTIWEGPPPPRLQDRIGFVECKVHVPDIHIPVLPVKDPESGKLMFPTGNLCGVWNWEELKLAIEEGAEIREWGKSVWFEKSPIFRDYVNTLYQYRDKSRADYDQGLSEIVKILLNATYGKFGMKTLRREIFLADDDKLPDGAEPANGDPESLVWYADREIDACYIMPQISAHVTTLARIRLYRKILKPSCCAECWPKRCRCSNAQIIAYTDTDSGLTPTLLPTSSALGELKDEYPEMSGRLYGWFLGPKTYLLTEDGEDSEAFLYEGDPFNLVKAKGLEKKSRELVEGLANGLTIHQWRLEKIGTLARAQFQRGPKLRLVPRRILKVDGKRQSHPDGSTSPYRFEMW